jgi:hypothetical protein
MSSSFDDIETLLKGLLETPDDVNSPVNNPAVFSDSADREGGTAPLTLPTFTNEEIAQAIDVRNFASLVTFNTRRWSAKVRDKQAARDAATASGADEAAFEAKKNLLIGADEKLRRIHKVADAARLKYYEMTLPWTSTGVDEAGKRTGARLLPNTLFFDFTEHMARYKQEMNSAIDAFVPEYPALVEQARQKLGTRFDILEYPNADSIRGHFDLSFDFQPVPLGVDFKGLPAQQIKALSRAIEEKTERQLENAMQDLWLRLHAAATKMVERLSHPDKVFHNTLVLNIESVAMQLKHLNVTNDPRVEDIRRYVAKNLCGLSVEDLRKKPTVRVQAAANAQTVLDMMAKAGGK